MVQPRLGDSGRHWGVTGTRDRHQPCALCGDTGHTMFYFDDNEGYSHEYLCRRCLQLAVHEVDKQEVF